MIKEISRKISNIFSYIATWMKRMTFWLFVSALLIILVGEGFWYYLLMLDLDNRIKNISASQIIVDKSTLDYAIQAIQDKAQKYESSPAQQIPNPFNLEQSSNHVTSSKESNTEIIKEKETSVSTTKPKPSLQ